MRGDDRQAAPYDGLRLSHEEGKLPSFRAGSGLRYHVRIPVLENPHQPGRV
jgi:hypothetical protein